MAGETTAFSMQAVAATLDGLPIRGYFDGDDVISIENGVDVGELMVGADGTSLFSQTTDRSAMITIKLQHTSPTHKQLLQKWKQQQAGRLLPFPFDVVDKNSNEGGTADQCYVKAAPTSALGKNATVREWVIVTGDYNQNVTK